MSSNAVWALKTFILKCTGKLYRGLAEVLSSVKATFFLSFFLYFNTITYGYYGNSPENSSHKALQVFKDMNALIIGNKAEFPFAAEGADLTSEHQGAAGTSLTQMAVPCGCFLCILWFPSSYALSLLGYPGYISISCRS